MHQGRSQGGAKGARAPLLAKRYMEGGTGKKYFRETKVYFSAGVHPRTSRALPLENSWLRAWGARVFCRSFCCLLYEEIYD